MNVAILCEFSGTVRDAFLRLGCHAVSCDLLPSESPNGIHYQGDLRNYDWSGYDLIICHPPCTHLAVSGAGWFFAKQQEQKDAIDFIKFVYNLRHRVRHFALEQPISIASSHIGKPTQIIQPWQFGHPVTKATCLWLHNLPKLKPTNIVPVRNYNYIRDINARGEARQKLRSKFFYGVAQAMALQWLPEISR